MQAVVEIFLHRRRIQYGNAAGVQDMGALGRYRGLFGGVVVASQHQHAAVFRAASAVAVLEDVAAAVHARAFAVPHGKHAIVLGVLEQIGLLGAPDGGGGQVFIEAGVEGDVVSVEMFLGLFGRHVDGG